MQETRTTQAWTDNYFTVSDGTRLHYVEMGEGTPVLLIHGFGGSAVGNWFRNGIAPALAPTNRVIGIDMRGHGLSDEGGPEARAKMADDVLEFMDQQGITKAHIGGYSMGGGVTTRILEKAPERFITAIFGGSGIRETEEWQATVPPDREGPDPEAEQARAAYQSVERSGRGEAVGNNPSRDRGAARGGAQRRPAPNVDLTRIGFPVLAVNGEYDRPLAKTHRMWRELRSFTNVVLPGKGHLSAVMEGFIPQDYIDAMVAFVTSNNPR